MMFIITQWCTRPPWTSPPSSSWTHPCSPAASYLTLLLTRATLPSGWEPPEDQTLFCPSLHPNRAQHSALNSFSPTSSVPSRIKDRTLRELLKTMPSSNILRSSQAPCSAKQANQALPLLVCQVNPTQSAKPSWDVNSFWRPQPAHANKTIPWCVVTNDCVDISTSAWLHHTVTLFCLNFLCCTRSY